MLPFVVAWQHFHVAGQNFEEIQLSGKGTVKGSLITRSKEEEEKGPGFSHLRMCLIAVEFCCLHILLIYSYNCDTNIDTKCYTVHIFS